MANKNWTVIDSPILSHWRCTRPASVSRLLGPDWDAKNTDDTAVGRGRARTHLGCGHRPALSYNEDQVRETFRLPDWMMHLRVDLERQLTQEIVKFEEVRKTPYITSVRRRGTGDKWDDSARQSRECVRTPSASPRIGIISLAVPTPGRVERAHEAGPPRRAT